MARAAARQPRGSSVIYTFGFTRATVVLSRRITRGYAWYTVKCRSASFTQDSLFGLTWMTYGVPIRHRPSLRLGRNCSGGKEDRPMISVTIVLTVAAVVATTVSVTVRWKHRKRTK